MYPAVPVLYHKTLYLTYQQYWTFHKVVGYNTSHLEAHAGVFRFLMNFWSLCTVTFWWKIDFLLVRRIKTHDYTIFRKVKWQSNKFDTRWNTLMSTLAFLSALLVKDNGNDHKSLLTLQTELNYTHQLTSTPAFCICYCIYSQ